MDPTAPIKRFDRFQQRHAALAIPLAVVKKFGDDGAGNLAALVAYYAFFSLFPLLLVFVTVLGYVLEHHPGTLHSIENSVSANFPAVNKVLDFTGAARTSAPLMIGLIGAFWSGLGVTSAAQNALDTVWAVPQKSRPNFIKSKLRGIGLLVSIGLLFVIATGASGLVSGGLGGVGTKVAGIVVVADGQLRLFLVAFRLMTGQRRADAQAVDRRRCRRRLLDDPAGRRRPLHRTRDQAHVSRLRHRRHRDRAADLAASRSPADAVRRRAERRARARTVAALADGPAAGARRSARPTRRWQRWRSATPPSMSTSASNRPRARPSATVDARPEASRDARVHMLPCVWYPGAVQLLLERSHELKLLQGCDC